MVSMGEFMAQGKTYEETYRKGLTITRGPSLRRLWEEMLAIADERRRSPLEALKSQEKLVASWLLSIFVAGVVAGVETIWIKGGRTFLEVWRALQDSPEPSNELQGRAFLKLVVTGIDLGLRIDKAVSDSLQIIENPKLKNFMQEAAGGLAAACRNHPEFFSASLVEIVEQDERSDTEFPYSQLANKITF
jgi:hypothetical protein